jgi:hypothetical protein
MSKINEVRELHKMSVAKAEYMQRIADDAASNNYWALARFARNEKQIALSEQRGLNQALLLAEDNEQSKS